MDEGQFIKSNEKLIRLIANQLADKSGACRGLDADDLFQEGCLGAIQHLRRRGQPETLPTAIRNYIIDALRAKRNRGEWVEIPVGSAEEVEAVDGMGWLATTLHVDGGIFEDPDNKNLIEKSIKPLPPRDRDIIKYWLLGWTTVELAERYSITHQRVSFIITSWKDWILRELTH